MTLGARIVVEQSSLVNQTHLLKPKSLVYSSSLVKKKILGSRGGANMHSGSSWVTEIFWDHYFGVAKRKGLRTAALEAYRGFLCFAKDSVRFVLQRISRMLTTKGYATTTERSEKREDTVPHFP